MSQQKPVSTSSAHDHETNPHKCRVVSEPDRSKIELQVQGLPQKDQLKKGMGEAKKILKGFASLSPSGLKDVRCNPRGGGGHHKPTICFVLESQHILVLLHAELPLS